LGRINEFVFFFPFSRSELHQLIKRELDFWAKKAKEKHGVDVTWDGQVLDALCLGLSLLSNTQQLHGFPKDASIQLYVHYVNRANNGPGTSEDNDVHQPQIRLRMKTKDSPVFTDIPSLIYLRPPLAKE